MKRVLSLVLALVMVLGAIMPAFAETTETAGEQLKDFGVIAGSDTGLDEDKSLTRAQAATILTEMYGKKEEAAAYAFDASFSDLEEGAWYLPYVAYVEAKGWMSGDGGTGSTFRPNDVMSAQEFNSMYVKVLGYDVKWEEVNAKATELGFAVKAADTTSILRGEAFTSILAALDVKTEGSEDTLGTKLALTGYEPPAPPVPETLEVVSVEALNLKEIQVTFNKDAEATKANFLVNGGAVATANFSESADGTVVTLFNASTPVAGQKVKVVVTGLTDVGTKHYEVIANDNSLPTIVSVDTVGNSLIKVTFSEPMNSGLTSISNFKIDGKVKSATLSMSATKKVLNIQLSSKLADGEYKLAINAANVKDFAGNAIGTNETEFAVAKYAATPEFTVLEATQETVKLQFDREPKTVDTIYWKSGSTEKHSAKGVVDSSDPTIYTFTFSATNRLANGDNTVYMHKVTDYSGNTTADASFAVSATIDTVRPEFVSVTQKTQTTFEFKFSKEVVATAGNYVIKDSKDVTVTPTVAYKNAGTSTEDKSIVVLTMSANTERSPYTVKISDVVDTTYLANKITDTTVEVVIEDETAPTVTGVSRSGNVVSVTFSEDIAGADLANFKYSVGGTYYDIPEAAYVTLVGTKAVNITFPDKFGPSSAHTVATSVVGNPFYVTGIADLAGNAIIASTTNVTGASSAVAVTGNVYAVDKNTLYVEVNGTLAEIWEGDFVVKAGTTTLAVTGAELVTADTDVNKLAYQDADKGNKISTFAANDQLIKLTLEKDLNADGRYSVSGTPTTVTVDTATTVELTKDALGNPLAIGTAMNVMDRIVPAAADDAKFTFANIAETLNVTTPFIADETVTVQLLVSTASDVSKLSQTTADIYGGALTVFDGTQTEDASAAVTAAGQVVYVRFLDSSSNYTAWEKIATKTPLATTATFTFDQDGNGTDDDYELASVTDTMEYSLDGGTTWTDVPAAATTVDLSTQTISHTNDIKVRVKAVTGVPAGTTQTIDILEQAVAPTIVVVAGTNSGEADFNGSTTAMEYKIDAGAWTNVGSANVTLTGLTTTGGQVIQMRVKASAAGTNNIAPAGAIYSVTLTDAQVTD